MMKPVANKKPMGENIDRIIRIIAASLFFASLVSQSPKFANRLNKVFLHIATPPKLHLLNWSSLWSEISGAALPAFYLSYPNLCRISPNLTLANSANKNPGVNSCYSFWKYFLCHNFTLIYYYIIKSLNFILIVI